MASVAVAATQAQPQPVQESRFRTVWKFGARVQFQVVNRETNAKETKLGIVLGFDNSMDLQRSRQTYYYRIHTKQDRHVTIWTGVSEKDMHTVPEEEKVKLDALRQEVFAARDAKRALQQQKTSQAQRAMRQFELGEWVWLQSRNVWVHGWISKFARVNVTIESVWLTKRMQFQWPVNKLQREAPNDGSMTDEQMLQQQLEAIDYGGDDEEFAQGRDVWFQHKHDQQWYLGTLESWKNKTTARVRYGTPWADEDDAIAEVCKSELRSECPDKNRRQQVEQEMGIYDEEDEEGEEEEKAGGGGISMISLSKMGHEQLLREAWQQCQAAHAKFARKLARRRERREQRKVEEAKQRAELEERMRQERERRAIQDKAREAEQERQRIRDRERIRQEWKEMAENRMIHKPPVQPVRAPTLASMKASSFAAMIFAK